MLDRTLAPELQEIDKITMLPPAKLDMAGKATCYWLKSLDAPAFKFDFIFNAGSIESKKIIGKLTGDLLFSGTKNHTSDAINEAIDQLGGFLNVEVTAEDAKVSVFGLTENFERLMAIVIDAIEHATFPDREVAQMIRSKRQGFNIAQEKVSTRARRLFLKEVFQGTPHAEQTELKDFDEVSAEDLRTFHKNYYRAGLTKVSLIGNLPEALVMDVLDRVGHWCIEDLSRTPHTFKHEGIRKHEEKDGAVQTAIRVGRILFNRTHEDYKSFMVLNTILGGYFGSRLMTSIREEKGYTYGIGSGVAQSLDAGYFFISTEVGKDVATDALEAIKEEIEKLQTELVSDEELNLVRSYSIGQLLKGSDGPFSMMDRFMNLERYGLDLSYYDEVLRTIKSIDAETIKTLAKKYLDWKDLVVVTAG